MCGVCVGGGGRVFNYTYIYSQTGRPCEVAELVGVLVAETIHPACMCEGGGRGGEGVEIETLLQLNLWYLGLVWFYRDFSQVPFQ